MNNEQATMVDKKYYEDRFLVLREEIDQVDSALLELLIKRVSIVLEVAEIKKVLTLEVFDAQREHTILENIKDKLNHKVEDPQLADQLLKIFESMLVVSKNIQRAHLGVSE